MGFKAKLEIDKFDDYMKLVSQGSEKTIIEKPVEKIIEVTKEEDPICPFCGGSHLKVLEHDDYFVYLNGNKQIKTQSVSVQCNDCNIAYPVHESRASKYQK